MTDTTSNARIPDGLRVDEANAARGPRADAVRNRERILASAVALLAANAEASMQDIADASGVTRMTVYRHFPDRHALFVAAAKRAAASVEPILDEMLRLPTMEAGLRHQARAIVALAVEHRGMLASGRMDELSRAAVADEPIQPFFALCRSRGEITSDLSDRWIAVLYRRVVLAAIEEIGTGRFTPAEAEDTLVRTVLAVAR